MNFRAISKRRAGEASLADCGARAGSAKGTLRAFCDDRGPLQRQVFIRESELDRGRVEYSGVIGCAIEVGRRSDSSGSDREQHAATSLR